MRPERTPRDRQGRERIPGSNKFDPCNLDVLSPSTAMHAEVSYMWAARGIVRPTGMELLEIV